VKANSLIAARLDELLKEATRTPLAQPLKALAAAPVVNLNGAWVLEKLVAPGLGTPQKDDLTGFEALTNKIHVSDYLPARSGGHDYLIQGVKYSLALADALRKVGVPFRIVLSRDPDTHDVTVRFFVRREGPVWGSDDPEAYQHEEVIQWDL
jgi:hypothetical protein